jgi:hypothetical protein
MACHVPDDDDVCWVCLEGSLPDNLIKSPCNCSQFSHTACLARWQLQSVGTKNETHCRFCDSELPDWKEAFTPSCGSAASVLLDIKHSGGAFSIEARTGPEGYDRFISDINATFNSPEDYDIFVELAHIYMEGHVVTLNGGGPRAYDAAMFCVAAKIARKITFAIKAKEVPRQGRVGKVGKALQKAFAVCFAKKR